MFITLRNKMKWWQQGQVEEQLTVTILKEWNHESRSDKNSPAFFPRSLFPLTLNGQKLIMIIQQPNITFVLGSLWTAGIISTKQS